jgi:hypothetical protein
MRLWYVQRVILLITFCNASRFVLEEESWVLAQLYKRLLFTRRDYALLTLESRNKRFEVIW